MLKIQTEKERSRIRPTPLKKFSKIAWTYESFCKPLYQRAFKKSFGGQDVHSIIDSTAIVRSATSLHSFEKIECGDIVLSARWLAGLPGLRFCGFGLIFGDFERFKEVSLDSESKLSERRRVNHLFSRFAIFFESQRAIRVTHFLNGLDHASIAD